MHHIFEAGQGAAAGGVNNQLATQVPAAGIAGGDYLAGVFGQADAVDFRVS